MFLQVHGKAQDHSFSSLLLAFLSPSLAVVFNSNTQTCMEKHRIVHSLHCYWHSCHIHQLLYLTLIHKRTWYIYSCFKLTVYACSYCTRFISFQALLCSVHTRLRCEFHLSQNNNMHNTMTRKFHPNSNNSYLLLHTTVHFVALTFTIYSSGAELILEGDNVCVNRRAEYMLVELLVIVFGTCIYSSVCPNIRQTWEPLRNWGGEYIGLWRSVDWKLWQHSS